ncbi:DUF192 domain-containing protein [Pseudidiomarina sp. E22-M8]|uniref:DUF192 domain-containing protein n=1 Tax=Pseudidiomarina sp. E22-M8 TaxID=3424768 RepID=UPI00403D1A46
MFIRTCIFAGLIGVSLSLAPRALAQNECSTEKDANCEYEVVKLCGAVGQPPMTVEIANTFAKRERGLMHRESLAEHHGMWFVYERERPGYSGFWMFNTKLPLDIAYLDQSLKVVKIYTMRPCTSVNPRNCPAYRPEVNYWGALEMPAGYFANHDIQKGTQLQQCEKQENNR